MWRACLGGCYRPGASTSSSDFGKNFQLTPCSGRTPIGYIFRGSRLSEAIHFRFPHYFSDVHTQVTGRGFRGLGVTGTGKRRRPGKASRRFNVDLAFSEFGSEWYWE